MDKYWMVHNFDNGQKPKVKHKTQRAAEEEATRLAKLHPGHSIVVLEAIQIHRAETPVTVSPIINKLNPPEGWTTY